MSHSTKKNVLHSEEPSQPALLRTADHLISEFERLLASELHLLKTGQADGLEAIADAKQVLVSQIDRDREQLIKLFNERPNCIDTLTLKKRLQQCRIDSRNNHALVVLELKHANKSLELLRSVLNMNDLSLYSESGKVRIKREKRKFGSA